MSWFSRIKLKKQKQPISINLNISLDVSGNITHKHEGVGALASLIMDDVKLSDGGVVKTRKPNKPKNVSKLQTLDDSINSGRKILKKDLKNSDAQLANDLGKLTTQERRKLNTLISLYKETGNMKAISGADLASHLKVRCAYNPFKILWEKGYVHRHSVTRKSHTSNHKKVTWHYTPKFDCNGNMIVSGHAEGS